MTRPGILMIRPKKAAQDFVKSVYAECSGHIDVCYSPVVNIEPVTANIDFANITHLVFTSANAVEQFAKLSAIRNIPALCVGKTTQSAAAAVGLTAAVTGLTVADLIHWLIQQNQTLKLHILYLRGEKISCDLISELSLHGVAGQEQVLYRQESRILTEQAMVFLKTQPVIVPAFSANSARNFLKSVDKSNTYGFIPVCISTKVAKVFQDQDINKTIVSNTPDRAGMICSVCELL
jgi:uroporphyrinogen-III synthase